MKRAPGGEETYYAGPFIFKGSNLEYILHAEGKYQVSEEDGGYQYNLKDHLGNVRLVVKGDETKKIMDQTDYYPFGMSMNMALYGSGQKNLYKYNGKELQDDKIGNGELDWYDYGARMYDPALGRFHVQDAFAEKYYDFTPYQYAANNPISFIDVNGDSIDFSLAVMADKALGTNVTNNIIDDNKAQTGLSLELQDGKLAYKVDKDGNPIIAKDKDGNLVGSKDARDMLISAIDNPDMLNVSVTKGSGSKSVNNGLQIGIDPDQIDNFIAGTSSDLDSRTMGYGMTFLHELDHSKLGSGLGHSNVEKTTFGVVGSTVQKMNVIRSQLGASYGTRTSYIPKHLSGNYYMPMSTQTKGVMNAGFVPQLAGKGYIKF